MTTRTARFEMEALLETLRESLSWNENEHSEILHTLDELEAPDAPDETYSDLDEIIDEAYNALDEIIDEHSTLEEEIEAVIETIALLDKLESNFRFLGVEV